MAIRAPDGANKIMGVVGHLYYNINVGVYHSHAWSGYQKLDPRANNSPH